jgi:hypothetical protein
MSSSPHHMAFTYLSSMSIYSRVEAMDVDNKEDYAEMAKKIISEKVKKVKIFNE